jgi:superfamily II DNA or RNA helicase
MGKTVLAAHIVAGARAKGKRVAFTVPRLSLIDQTVERFIQNGIDPLDIGVSQADHPARNDNAPIQVVSVQTMARRGYPDCDIAIIDECHIRFDIVDKWLVERLGTIFIGLSATPWSKGLGLLWDDLIISASMQELIADGYLCDFRAFAPSHVDVSNVKIVKGDYHEGELSGVMQDTKLVGDVVETWCNKAEERPTLLFAVDRAHARVLADQFQAVGVPIEYVDAFTTREERNEINKRFQAGQVKVICSVGTMTTGVDLDVRCISFCRPTKSEILLVQALGRGLRTADGKRDCLILDHSDSMLRLGLPTEIGHDALDTTRPGEKRAVVEKSKEQLPIECKECNFLIPAHVFQCPQCGWTRRKHSMVFSSEGELFELGTSRARKKENRITSEDEKREFFAQLLGFGDENGYKRGWAARKYKERFGVWPNHYGDTAPAYCGSGVRAWVRRTQRAWAVEKAALDKREMVRIAREMAAT